MTFITDTIAIGNFVDAENRAAMEVAGIRSILCLNGHFYDCTPADCGVEALTCFNLRDGPGNAPWLFDRAVKIVGEYALKHPKLLVHCHAGRSRSVMVVASHLVRMNAWDLRQALALIHAKRPEIVLPDDLLSTWDVNNEGRIA
ncbi:MAG: dual specificity protein phosphatase [Prosthecobacter sp.]|uniref:dual specificity protein phosphatase family protein n=1 Tax=Prosthecobacter sp. TaxID=1965333 RepID=UPI003BB1D8AF